MSGELADIEFIRRIARPLGPRKFAIDGFGEFALIFDGDFYEGSAEGSFDVLVEEPPLRNRTRILRDATKAEIGLLLESLRLGDRLK